MQKITTQKPERGRPERALHCKCDGGSGDGCHGDSVIINGRVGGNDFIGIANEMIWWRLLIW